MKQAVQMVRQGDVLLVRVARVPKSAQPQPTVSPVVLALGEVTGHAHTVDRATVSLDEGGVMFLTIAELTEVRHEEHNPINIEPGIYKVIRQREYSPAEIRSVVD